MDAFWKLSALALTVGIGAMVVVQAQKELKDKEQTKTEEPAGDGEVSDADLRVALDDAETGQVPPQREPDFSLDGFDEGDAEERNASAKSRAAASIATRSEKRRPLMDDGDSLAEPSTPGSEAAVSNDPFSDEPADRSQEVAERSEADSASDRLPRLGALVDEDSSEAKEPQTRDGGEIEGPRLTGAGRNTKGLRPGATRSRRPQASTEEPRRSRDDDLDDEAAHRIRFAGSAETESNEPDAAASTDSDRVETPSRSSRPSEEAIEVESDPADDEMPRLRRTDPARGSPAEERSDSESDEADTFPKVNRSDERSPSARHDARDDDPIKDEPARAEKDVPRTLGDPFGDDEESHESLKRDTREPAETPAEPEGRERAANSVIDEEDALPSAARSKPAPAALRDTPPALMDDPPAMTLDRSDSAPKSRPRSENLPKSDAGNSTDEATFRIPPATALPERPAARRAPRPKLTIEKTAPSTAVLGRPMIYRIKVKNDGPVPARQVVVEDTIAQGVTIDGSIPQAQLDERRLIWKLGTLAPGDEKVISVRVIPENEGTLGSVATVNFSNDPAAAESAAAPKLQFDLTAPSQAVAGSGVLFKFRVTNVGRADASGVMIRNVLPAGLRHPDGDDLEYEIGLLPAGKSREVDLTLTAAQAGKTVNRAIVTADGNLTEEASTALEIVGPALSVKRAGPRRMFPGKQANYTNTVTNPGSSAVTDVRIVETVPPGMEFVSATDGGHYDREKRTITWTLDRLEAGESRSVRSALGSSARGAQVGVVRAYDSSGASGEAVGTTHVSGVPALTIEIGDVPSLIDLGEQITVPVRILNRGSDTATNVRPSVALPAGMELVEAKAPTEHRVVPSGTPAIARRPPQTETADPDGRRFDDVQFAPLTRLDPGGDFRLELTLKAVKSGNVRVQVEVRCDQIADPIRREEITTIAAPPEEG